LRQLEARERGLGVTKIDGGSAIPTLRVLVEHDQTVFYTKLWKVMILPKLKADI
jgi:hypothetical protein